MNPHIRRTVAVFAVLIVSLLVGFAIAFRTTSRIAGGEQWVNHTYSVLVQLDSIEIGLRRADRAGQEFLRSSNTLFDDNYKRLNSDLDMQLAALANLIRDNRSQRDLVSILTTNISDWRGELDQALAEPAKGNSLPAPNPRLQAALETLGKMRNVESGLLQQRLETSSGNLRLIRIGLMSFMIADLCFLVLAGYLVIRGEYAFTRERESRNRVAAIVDSSDDAIVGKTLDGILTSWNLGAEKLYGYKPEEVIGKHINVITPPERQGEMDHIFETLRSGGKIDHLETERVCRDGRRIQVELTVSPIYDERKRVVGASAIARNVTERKQMEASLRDLSARILQAEDEERRRIARDLHDTTVQELALLSINIAQLKGISDPQTLEIALADAHELTNRCVQDLRTLSYVLHPPMLDELGLASALKIYAEGFSKRSGVSLNIEVGSRWERLKPDLEIALFRVAQESLSNVVRHSGSPGATIKLERNGEIRMAVIDQGRGVLAEDGKPVTWGVGFLGMRERIKHFGGTLTIDSGPNGTSVEARLPLSREKDGESTNPDRG